MIPLLAPILSQLAGAGLQKVADAVLDKGVEHVEEKLGIKDGQTIPDSEFTLETVECLGNCDHAPCLMVDDEDFGPVSRNDRDRVLRKVGLG